LDNLRGACVLEVCWYGAGADKISQIRAGAGGAGADKKIQPRAGSSLADIHATM